VIDDVDAIQRRIKRVVIEDVGLCEADARIEARGANAVKTAHLMACLQK
jgi:replication-associated recombination protein RarA